MSTKIVVDLGFGDSGKGKMVDYLAGENRNNSVVVRFSGGQQAGHTVMRNGIKHIFSNFGSATLQNVPTYWSRFCTFYPIGVCNEYEALTKYSDKIHPNLYVDAMSMVTTPFDVAYNRAIEKYKNQHGSCGMGIAQTMQRNTTPYKLYVNDLTNSFVYSNKMLAIQRYYSEKLKKEDSLIRSYYDEVLFDKDLITRYDKYVQYALDIIEIAYEKQFFKKNEYANFIFEGSQGVMLDMDFGIFPHVTYANTTSKNAMQLIKDNNLETPDIYYVTRAYQTRHGYGPMSVENYPIELINTEEEINKFNDWQTNFRTGLLDISLLKHAITCDQNFLRLSSKTHLSVSCLDQIDTENWKALLDDKVIKLNDVTHLGELLGFSKYSLYSSNSHLTTSVKLVNEEPKNNYQHNLVISNGNARTIFG